jgi:hypothetical protein
MSFSSDGTVTFGLPERSVGMLVSMSGSRLMAAILDVWGAARLTWCCLWDLNFFSKHDFFS